MNPSPIEELEGQLEQTRQALRTTMRDLRFRLSPSNQAAMAWRAMKQEAGRAAPIVVLVLGIVGVAYLVATRSHRRPR